MAFVFYASFSLWAMRTRILLIGTLVSVLDPAIPAGVTPGAAGFTAGLGASAGF